jgi:FecR protein
MFQYLNGRVGRLCAHALLLAAMVTCACPIWAQLSGDPPDGAAVITSLTGRVDVLRDSIPYVLEVGGWVKPGQMIVTGPDSGAIFRLADGSTFEVYSNSRVTFRASQGNWRDLLDVWLGNIRVHIQKLGGQPNNNRVHTPTALISVRGTTFDVNVEDNGDTTFVMVEEGLVDVEHISLPGKRVSLSPGEAIRVYKNVPLAQSHIDKGSVAQAVARGLAQGVYEILLNRQRTPGSGSTSTPTPTSGGGTGVGDTPAPTPPPPPPPPPPQSAPPPPPSH